MADTFYPFVETSKEEVNVSDNTVKYPARIAVFDDLAAAPRVVIIEPKDIRSYLEEITSTVTKLAKEQGGHIPFMVIREVVENFIHAYFIEPTISILNDGDTIRFSDQGPGINEKERALEYGTTSATEEMKKYIRGVGSGLPYAQQYMLDHGGSLTIDDNINSGTIVTISYGTPLTSSQIHENHGEKEGTTSTYKLNDRSQKIIKFLSTHDFVGPKDLNTTFGDSEPTWSRQLKELEEQGILKKQGQKRYLTEVGKTLLS